MNFGIRSTYFLCIIGLLKEFRPSEPFVFEYLTGPFKNFTENEVNAQLYPISSYSNFVSMIFMFLLTDICKCKPLIILTGVYGILIWSLLIWGWSFTHLIFVEIFYGFLLSSEIAYSTYPYKKLPPQVYQKVTGLIKAATLTGNTISGIVGQLLVVFNVLNYKELNYITLVSMILVTIFAIFLEKVSSPTTETTTTNTTIKNDLRLIFGTLKSYKNQLSLNKKLQKLSLFWSLLFCLFLLVSTYMQSLWHKINADQSLTFYNGFIDSFLTLLSAITALIAGYLKIDWNKHEICISIICLVIQSLTIISASMQQNLYYAYLCYIIYRGVYQFLITLCTAEIAKNITNDCCGFVFAANNFVALFLQIVLINIFVKETFFSFNIRQQMGIYGLLHLVIVLIFCFFKENKH